MLADLPVEPAQFAIDLVIGVGPQQEEIDGCITRFARDWTLERMPALDRALLRMAHLRAGPPPDVPTGAVISEAVELAKRFSTDDSGRFVNGVLSSIARRRPGRPGWRSPGGLASAPP